MAQSWKQGLFQYVYYKNMYIEKDNNALNSLAL